MKHEPGQMPNVIILLITLDKNLKIFTVVDFMNVINFFLLIYIEKYAIKFKKFNSRFMVSTPITQQSFDFSEQKEFDAIPAYFIKLNAGYCEDKLNSGEFNAYIACPNKESNHFVINLGESLDDISSSPIEHLAPDPTPVESKKKSSGRVRKRQKEKTKRASNE